MTFHPVRLLLLCVPALAALGFGAPARAASAADELETALAAAGPALKLPPSAQPFFEPLLTIGPAGELVKLDLADPALAPLEAQWTAALEKRQPLPRPPGPSGTPRPLEVSVVRHRLVPGSVAIDALEKVPAPEAATGRALLRLALESLSGCAEAGPPALSTARLDGVQARFDASGALMDVSGIPSAAPFAPCLDASLRAVKLSPASAERSFQMSFAVESGPARVLLTLAETSERLPAARKVLRDEEGALRVCFDEARRTDPSLAGRLRTRLVIDDRGAVVAAQIVESTVASQQVERCALSVLQKLQFSAYPSDRPLSVVHTILFKLESLRGAPDADAGSWLTASSEHFVLYTEGGRAIAQRALEEAERTYQGLRLALALNLGTVPDDARPMTLVVFSAPGLYTQVASLNSGGQFRAGVLFGEEDVLLLAGVGSFEVLRHEITHRLVSKVAPRLPAWLSEGLAQYYEKTEIGDDSITVGSTPLTRAAHRLQHRAQPLTPLPELLAASRASFNGLNMRPLYHASFWLTTALESDPGDRVRLNQLIQGLRQGKEAGAAVRAAFPAPELARLAGDYPLQMTTAEPVSYRRAWTSPAAPAFAFERLDGADGRVLVARLYGANKAGRAREVLAEALALAPDRAEAYARRALLVPASAEERQADAERAVQLDPAGRLGWEALAIALLSDAKQNGPRLREAAGRLEGFGESAEAQCLAAVVRDALGDAKSALAASRKAVRLAPSYFYGQAVFARLAERAGLPAQAREALANAYEVATRLDPRSPQLLRPDRMVTLQTGK